MEQVAVAVCLHNPNVIVKKKTAAAPKKF